jgi:3-phenylpropionate/cinnamic acid dioxygenase small subunit
MGESDEQAIRNLLFEYAARIDAGDLAGMAALFAHARYVSGDGPALRGAAPVERINRALVILYEDGTPRTRHLTTNVRIEVDPAAGRAEARSLFTVLQQAPGRPIEPIVAGRYEDAFERAEEGWRFAARRIHVDMVGDLSRHLRLDRLGDLAPG